MLLQDWMGYTLTPDTSLQKILLCIGPPRSGKGTVYRIQADLLGSNSVAGPNMTSLGKDFGLQGLITKMLAVISDAASVREPTRRPWSRDCCLYPARTRSRSSASSSSTGSEVYRPGCRS